MFDYRIDTFLMAAKTLNFTKAANQLHITQPAVSMHIHQLEDEYQTKFFIQDGKHLQLTENGKQFYQVALRMKNDDHHLRQHFIQNKGITELNFGCTLTISDYCLQDSLKKLWQTYPQLHLNLYVGNTQNLLEKIKDGTLDFAIVEGFFSKDLYDHSIFSKQEYIPVCAKDHVFSKEIQSIKDLKKEPLLLREQGSGTREILERVLTFHNLSLNEFNIIAQIGSLNTIKQCVQQDLGISFFYRPVVQKELQEKNLCQIQIQEKIHHTFSCVWSKTSFFSNTYKEIADILKDC